MKNTKNGENSILFSPFFGVDAMRFFIYKVIRAPPRKLLLCHYF